MFFGGWAANFDSMLFLAEGVDVYVMHMRSLMFVPAEDKRLDKVGKAEADAYIIDLEDSIASSDKAAALERAVQFLSARGGGTDRILVRLDSELYFEEMERLSVFQELGFMLPKMDNPNKYVDCAEVLQSHMVIALIESPCALMNSREIEGN